MIKVGDGETCDLRSFKSTAEKMEKLWSLTNFFSILALMSLASVKKASSTFIDALALVSRNFIPYSTANCSPLSLDTWQ